MAEETVDGARVDAWVCGEPAATALREAKLVVALNGLELTGRSPVSLARAVLGAKSRKRLSGLGQDALNQLAV